GKGEITKNSNPNSRRFYRIRASVMVILMTQDDDTCNVNNSVGIYS
ncbi:10563_t:CDS:2, partial [Gigaspora rosea]